MNRLDKLLEQMIGAIQKGRPQIALSLASSLTDISDSTALLHLKGVAYAMLEQLVEATDELEKAHHAAPGELQYITDLAQVWIRRQEHQRAVDLWHLAISICETDIALWDHLAQSQIALGEMDAAAESYRKALQLDPEHVLLWCNLAGTLKRDRQFEQSLAAWQKALEIEPNHAVALTGLGSLKLELKDYDGAQRLLEQASSLSPDALEPRVNLVLVAIGQARWAEALGLFMSQGETWRKSDLAREIHASILDGQSSAALLRSDFEEAEQFARAALEKVPDLSSAWLNLGQVLRVHGDWQEAIDAYTKSAECADGDLSGQVAAWLTLPILYSSQEEITHARKLYTQGLNALVSEFPPDSLDDLEPALQAASNRTNFQLAYQQGNDLALQKQYGEWVSGLLARKFDAVELPQKIPNKQRIRVGFISSYWWRHTVGKLFRGWVEGLDRDDFEIVVYHLGTRQDEVTQNLALAADSYVNIQGLPAQVKRIREDKIDVLIYPEVGMDSATMTLAALRLAPVQCVAWGHPVTTGLPTMDYFLSSEAMEPTESAEAYSEQLVKLPGLSIAYSRPVLPELVRTRPDFGLPEDKVLYLCCQSLFKYLPENDEVWVNIRKQVPNAHFVFIHNKSSKITNRLKTRLASQFQAVGLELEDSVTFVEQLAFEDYLQLNGLCDIYLDSLGWSGGNTSLEALAWGLPMVTLAGQWMRGRHTAAILSEMDMGDWVANDRSGYVERAIMLGEDEARRKSVSEMLIERSRLIYGDTDSLRALEGFLRKVSTRE